MTKSKVMCLNKQGKQMNDKFSIDDKNLECVQTYPYLGIEISNSGSFKTAQKALSDKASRALFKLKSLLHSSNLKPSVCMKLFDQLIKPICLYGSELWGTDLLKTSDLHVFLESMTKSACEKLNISFCRFVLGVHKKSQLSAVRGELGRFPLAVDIVADVVKYGQYLEAKDKDSLLYEALSSCKSMPESTPRTKYWASQCTQLKQLLTDISPSHQPDFSNRKYTKRCIEGQYRNMWSQKIKLENKMRTYNKFKTSFIHEDYLSIKNEQHRKAMTKFRISAHSLAIEKGRYTTTPTAVENRICKYCPEYIEDEYHFLMDCSKYKLERDKLCNTIEGVCTQFKNLCNHEKFIYMLSADVDVAEHVGKFIYENSP